MKPPGIAGTSSGSAGLVLLQSGLGAPALSQPQPQPFHPRTADQDDFRKPIECCRTGGQYRIDVRTFGKEKIMSVQALRSKDELASAVNFCSSGDGWPMLRYRRSLG
ncbi:hypothetical protein KIP88_43590 [Bradyrhizobium sp. SRL28]|uniref:hypothetical protein n=1 Tax=Bradyrhizobium sp. SRL28 TaxID=2836178 RepID=UPI001BDE3263|nr:hypothetical protein [Bradyrhizobium sp. SRL28]MBT1517224.1 hypothetical protein [Bradyrhizobium sp. SRL28]